jgi:hypothetical protein
MRIQLKELGTGIIKDKAAHELPPGIWTDGQNVTFRDNRMQKAKGNTPAYGTPSIRPQWLVPFQDPESGNYHWVYPGIDDNDHGRIYSVTGSNHTNRTRQQTTAITAISTDATTPEVTAADHGLTSGDTVTIANVSTGTFTGGYGAINTTHVITVTGTDTFSVTGVECTVSATDGDVTGDLVYSPSALIPWSGGVLNGLVVINNGVDVPQKWDRTGGNLNTRMENLENWPSGYSARIIRPFREFLIAMDVTDTGSNPSRNPYRLMWSDAADPNSEPSTWAAGADNLAGDVFLSEGQDFIIDGAPMRGNFIVYKSNSTWIMRYVGGNDVFTIDRLFNEHGLMAPRCYAPFGDGMHFVVTKGDVIIHDGNTARSVADDKVRKYIFDEIDSTNFQMAFCTPYYRQEEIWFCYPTSNTPLSSRAAIWNYKTQTWTFRELHNCPHIGFGTITMTGSYTWDTLPYGSWNAMGLGSWDAHTYSPASDDVMMIERGATDTTANASFQQVDSGNTFDGTSMTSYARMEKIDLINGEEMPDGIKFCNRLYPKIRGGPVNIRVGASMAATDPVSWSAYYPYGNGDYKIDTRKSGRYLALEISSSTDVDWELDSLEMEVSYAGNR